MGSAAAGLRAQLWVLALGEDRLSIHTAGSSIPALSAGHPSLPGWERSWGGGKDGGQRGREGGREAEGAMCNCLAGERKSEKRGGKKKKKSTV